MKFHKKHLRMLSASMIILAVLWSIWANKALKLQKLTITSADLPQSFDGYKVAHLSDLHNTEFGRGNHKLLRLLAGSQADLIVITGDLIDARHTDIGIALDFVKKAAEIAPVYYVTGNHESRMKDYETLEAGIVACGARVLHNQGVQIPKDGQAIQLLGVDDPEFLQTDWLGTTQAMAMDTVLRELTEGNEQFTMLLSHRPELFAVYASNKIDLVFSGHAHGGQFRLPLIGGLIAPNQGLFPKYDAGLYTKNHTHMVVSRGLGNSIIPLRLNNRPEVLVVSLQKAKP